MQQITVGLDPTVALVTAVDVSVLVGPPLSPLFTSALTSPGMLNTLTQAVRATPPNLLEMTPQSINIPQQITQTYQPPKGSLFFPETLFQLQFSIARIVARPLNAAQPGPGVLAVAVDVGAPVATAGDAAALIDLTGTRGGGPTIETDDSGVYFAPGGGGGPGCNIAVCIDSTWVTAIMNTVVSPQLSGKFLPQLATNYVSFSNSADCLSISFGDVTASLDDPLSPPIPTNQPISGMTLRMKATKWTSASTDHLGYYQGSGLSVEADVNARIVILLMQNGKQSQPKPQAPALTNDYYGAFVIGHDISLPWWIDALAIFAGGPIYLTGSLIAGLFGVDIFYPTIVANANNVAGMSLQGALGGLAQEQKSQLLAQLPGTTVPNWSLNILALGLSSDTCGSFVNLGLLPSGIGSTVGSYPYLMVTDQAVADPSAVPDVPGYPFPIRFDGAFNWPGITYNQQGQGAPGGSCDWDVHDLNPIGVVLKIPPGIFNPLDPTIRVSWTAIRADNNAQIVSQTLSLNQPGALSITIPHASAALQKVSGFQVNCTVTQLLAGGGQAQIFSSGDVYVNVQDHFDRSHPFATWWSHKRPIYPGQPFWNAIPARERVRGVRWLKTSPQSRIHRTDYWAGGRRCLVAETSGLMGNPPHGKPLYDRAQVPRAGSDFDYLDHLPISLAEVQQDRDKARGILCDYCFFGGPTKTALRADFPTVPSGGLPQQ